MSKADTEQDAVERLMRRAHLHGPSEVLKTQVTAAALNAWNRDEAGVPARIAFGRLAVSMAAAVILVALADGYGNRALSPWQSGTVTAVHHRPPDTQKQLDLPRPVVARHARLHHEPASAVEASALREHIRRIREILSECETSGNAESDTPVGGRSRLIPVRPRLNATS